jgi:hypothetical protein
VGKGLARDEELGVCKLNMKEVLSRTRSPIEFWDSVVRGVAALQEVGMIQTSYEQHVQGTPPPPPLHPLLDPRKYVQRLIPDSTQRTAPSAVSATELLFNKSIT